LLVELEAREMDVAVIPAEPGAARFQVRPLYDEDFLIGVRAGHPFAAEPTLEQFCALRHVVVSLTGDPTGFVDAALAERGVARRVALTVPNFAMALAVVADGELAAALPRRFLAMQGRRFGVVAVEAPLPLPLFRLNAVVPKAALMDDGVAWLLDRLCESPGPPAENWKAPRPTWPRSGHCVEAGLSRRSIPGTAVCQTLFFPYTKLPPSSGGHWSVPEAFGSELAARSRKT
jgi:DNA-binding transcriptional LysR family regulator